MDVASTRFGTRARDRDDLALQVQNVFKRFLEEYSAGDYDEQDDSNYMETSEITNDSFSSAYSSSIKAPKPKRVKRNPSQLGGDGQEAAQAKASKYAEEALLLLTNERNTLFIDFKDVELFDTNLAEDIICEYYRFYPYLCRALAAFVREEKMRQTESEIDPNADVSERMRARESTKRNLDRPQILNKDYYVGFYNFAQRENIRDLSSVKIGTLTKVSAQVVRTHSVHPELVIGCFKCKDCLSIQYAEQQFRYSPPDRCSNENCSNRSRFELILEKSRFTDFQRLHIQETQQELPRGCLPRSFDVVVRGADQVECIQPGDQCDFIGSLLAIPDVGQMMAGTVGTVLSDISSEAGITGLNATGVKEMTYSLVFLANACIIDGQQKPCVNTDENFRDASYNTTLDVQDFSKEEIMKIQKMSEDTNLLDNLAQSLFASVYGNDEVKRGIILQLLGGVPKTTDTGTKLRGDINICLVGDPSTAKSQFLRIVTDCAPVKAVYASGKGSSASGLTAAVVRDTDGGYVIEAGALMLADRGICCIDEFDKMDLKDQVAIHEAMEQQTISITKAGVTATLNARASILAAANPIGNVYDKSRDLRSNLSFSLPIMSRFDLFFTLIDTQDEVTDAAIGSKILNMHKNYANPDVQQKIMPYTFDEVRLYLRFARKYCPKIPVEVRGVFVQEFVRLRSGSTRSKTSWRITIRQLESLVRLSEAIARAYCKELVTPEYVKLAARLIERTIVHVGSDQVELNTDIINETTEIKTSGSMMESQGLYEGETESQPLEPTQPTQKSMQMSLSAYKDMAEVLMRKLRVETESQEGDVSGMKRSDLVDWYLHQCLSDISTESELIQRKQLCEQVISRLVKIDHLLMEMSDGEIMDPLTADSGEDRIIILNPELSGLEHEDFFAQIVTK